jgi:uncharacterized protein YecE (DUF72 family)
MGTHSPLTTHHSLFIGTCGWWYADWQGIVYPDLDRHDPLAFMARYFDALEINVSFYRDVNPAMAASWLRRVEQFRSFQFTAKLHQRFTHERRDQFPAQEIMSSLGGLEPLREAHRMGALLAQFPWSYRDDASHRDWLRHIRDACAGYRLVVELRHDSWLRDDAVAFLRSLGVGFCNIDQPAHDHCIPPTEMVMSPVGYVRLHGRNHARWFDHDEASQRYDYLYTEHELDAWVGRIRRIAQQAEDTFVFTNNHFRGQAPANALELKAKLAGDPVPVPDLMLDEFPVLGKFAQATKHERQRRLFQ